MPKPPREMTLIGFSADTHASQQQSSLQSSRVEGIGMAASNFKTGPRRPHPFEPMRRRAIVESILAWIAIETMSLSPYCGAHWLLQRGLWTAELRAVFEVLPDILHVLALLLVCRILRTPVWPYLALELKVNQAHRRTLALTIVFAVVLLFAVKAAIFLWLQSADPQGAVKLMAGPPTPPTGYAWWPFLVSSVLTGPTMEEIVYRGFLINRLEAAGVKSAVAIGISAACFGAIHFGKGIEFVAFAMFAGAVLGWVRVKTGSTIPAIVLHSAWNASSLMLSGLATSPPT